MGERAEAGGKGRADCLTLAVILAERSEVEGHALCHLEARVGIDMPAGQSEGLVAIYIGLI
jgi:hypothetical protein